MKSTLLFIFLSFLWVKSYGQITLDEYLELESYYSHFNGVIWVSDGEYSKVFSNGYADKVSNEHNQINTAFDIGSISKQFTAAGILTLVYQGKLKLDDKINIHLGELKRKRWKNITVHQLLCHTSGIPSLYQSDKGMELILPTIDAISIDSLISFFHDKKTLFKPGKKYSYSNSGYILLAAIIENVSGISFKDFMQLEIFEKYELKNTSFGLPSHHRYAKPYFNYRSDLIEDAPINDESWMIGAGGIYSSVGDLSIWLDVIHSDEFLNEELREKFFQNQVSKRGGYYSYGWEYDKESEMIQHDGTNFGYISYLGHDPEKKRKIIILTNQSYKEISMLSGSEKYIGNLKSDIMQIFDGDTLESQLPKPFSGTRISSNFLGEFQLDTVSTFIISSKDSLFTLKSIEGKSPLRVISETPIEIENDQDQKMHQIAYCLLKKKFGRLSKISDKGMKTAIRLGLIRLGYNIITKELGEINEVIPYYVGDKKGYLRLKGDKMTKDLVIYFNDEGYLQGLFEHQDVMNSNVKEIVAFPASHENLYLDGFPYGENSATLILDRDTIILRQFGRELKGHRQGN